jgi:alpha-ketoglutarate-dependent taurine dioxygenase
MSSPETGEGMTSTVSTLPLVVESDGTSITEVIEARRAHLRQALIEHGAVLFRGFDVGGVEGFDQVVRALSGSPLAYTERSSPRHVIKGNVYTSTDYPPEEEITLHNEHSYRASWPLTLYFYCTRPPATQGATPLADTRRIYAGIDPAVREEFARRRWMLVRNLYDDFGVAWQHFYDTEDRDEVTAYCAKNGIDAEWRGDGGLRTRAVRDAVHFRPGSDVPVWFNHITFFHMSTLAKDLRDGLLAMFGEDGLPYNTYYGDGGVIPGDVMDHLRDVYRATKVRFDYRRDDILVVDNMTAAHGREPFTGPRKVAVAMADLHVPAKDREL